jgi:FkbM family methyltransferase
MLLMDRIRAKLQEGRGSLKRNAAAPAQPAPPFSEPEIAVIEDGKHQYRFVCHSSKERNRAKRLFDKEKGTIAWLKRELRPDDVFYDVGANIGTYTIYAAYRLGPAGVVYSFEPHIANAHSLLQNICENGQTKTVQVVTAALSNAEQYGPFNYQSVREASSTSQFGRNAYEGETFEIVFREIKHACRLDTLVASGAIKRPNLVKIDVDGLDFEVLEGMRELMAHPQRPRSIQIELGSESKPNIMAFCAALGYSLKEKHWSEAGIRFIEEGNDPEAYPHYGIFAAGSAARS